VVLLLGVAAAVVAVDQVTKTLALHHLLVPRHVVGTLWLELTFNAGAAFGLGRGATPVVEAAVVALIAALMLFARRATRRAGPWFVAGCGLLLGGALGNLADRVFRAHSGAVIDFMDVAQVGRRELWPVFNVADASIVVGAIVLAVAYAFGPHRAPAEVGEAEVRPPEIREPEVPGQRVEAPGVDAPGVEAPGLDERGVDGRA
jgi:signal peptidase II